MKKNLIFAVALATIFTVFSASTPVQAQDILYMSDVGNNSTALKKAVVNPNTGAVTTAPASVRSIYETAALSVVPSYGYYITYGDGSGSLGEGKMRVYSVKTDGSQNSNVAISSFDVNGSSDKDDVNFVRLGADKNGINYIIAKNANTNKISVATFVTGVAGTASTPVARGTATTSDGRNDLFFNGDLAVDGNGIIYGLANNNSQTRIYTLNTAAVLSGNASSSYTLQYKWTVLKQNGDPFTTSVNGLAWSSTGSLYISTGDGIYFLDQNTANGVTGTVKVKKVYDIDGLTDLASCYWPEDTKLPVTFGEVNAVASNGKLIVNWSTQTETNNSRFEVEASTDGKNFTKIGEVSSKATGGTSSQKLDYSFTTSAGGVATAAVIAIGLLCLPIGMSRRKRILLSLVMLFTVGGFVTSCSKGDVLADVTSSDDSGFIRIKQINTDGNSDYSKVVKVVKQ